MKVKTKVICLLSALLAVGNGAVEAQTSTSSDKYKVETNSFWDNWFIQVGGGGQVYFGDGDSQGSLGKRIAPALDVAVGKWFTPGLGVRLEYSGLQIKGFGYIPGSYATGARNNKGAYAQKWDVAHLHGDVLLNVSNVLFGYNEARVYNFIPYVGVGVMHSWDKPKTNELAATVGLINQFRLSSAFSLNLEARGTLIHDRFDSEVGGNGKEGLLAVTAGLTYRFKQRGWTSGGKVMSTGISEEEMRRVREQLASAEREKQSLQNALDEARRKPAQTIVEKELVGTSRIIVFPLGKSTLTKQGRVNLGYYAEAIKSAPADKVFTIVGYADNKTGSDAINMRLSKERAEAVRDALVKEFGVNPSQLRVEHKGGVANMFYDDAALSRAVIVD